MLHILAVVLSIAWLLGMISDVTAGGMIHWLMAGALILVLVDWWQRGKLPKDH